MEKQVKSHRILYIIAFGAMLIMGYMDSMRGPLVPKIRETFNISYSSIGIMLFTASLGFLISTFFGGMLCDRLGQKRVMFFGFFCVVLGTLGITYSANFAMFVSMMGLLNIGFGAIEISINTLVSVIPIRSQAVLMNLLHFFYGAGASMGPRYSGQLLSMNIIWRYVYLYSLVLVVLLFIFLAFTSFPAGAIHSVHGTLPVVSIIKNKKVLLFGAIIGFYYASELGIVYWFSNYLEVVYGMDALKSSTYLSVFFILFTIGRLCGGFIVERIGHLRSVIGLMVLTLGLFATGILLNERFVILVSLCGLTYATIFPTMVTVALGQFKESTSSTIGIIITIATGINMTANWFMGKLNDLLGVKRGFSLLSVYIIIVIVLVVALVKMIGVKTVNKSIETV